MSAAKSAGGTTPPEVEHVPPPLPAGIRAALRVFKAHFPELLKKHKDKWVACDGEQVLYIGDSQEVLYNRCRKRGLKEDEFIVLFTLPDAIEYID